ncbi:MAG: response regulator [Alphaproteobacteria bacterium]|nr:response regulator [Alphaproteobacteria bacterium]
MKGLADITAVIAAKSIGMAQPLRMALRGMGVRNIHVAVTPKQVVEAFQTSNPDVLIAIVQAPEGDEGLSLIRFIRRWEKSPNPRIPIVAASARAEMPVVSAVLNAGGNEFLIVPASGDQLMKKITSAIQTNRPFIDGPTYVGPDRRRRQDPDYSGPERRVAPHATDPQPGETTVSEPAAPSEATEPQS